MKDCKKIFCSDKWKLDFVSESFDDAIVNSNEVIIKSHFTHLSAGTEMACISGLESFFQIPDTPGYTAVGEIVAKGEAVAEFKEGDLVYTYGPHKQYFKIDVTDRWHGICVKLPEGINSEHAAFTHMAGIAMTAIRNSSIELGDWVLITGLGTIGNMAAQLAQLQGANVIATDIDDKRIELASKSGIKHAVNSSKVDIEKYIKERCKGNLVSTYIDATGVSAVVNKSLNLVELYGEVILLGSPRAPFETNITETFQKFHLLPHSLTMKGALEFTYPTHKTEFSKHSITRNAEIIMDLIREEKLVIEHVYSHKLHPAKAQQAYEGLRDKKDEYIGIVFDWREV